MVEGEEIEAVKKRHKEIVDGLQDQIVRLQLETQRQVSNDRSSREPAACLVGIEELDAAKRTLQDKVTQQERTFEILVNELGRVQQQQLMLIPIVEAANTSPDWDARVGLILHQLQALDAALHRLARGDCEGDGMRHDPVQAMADQISGLIPGGESFEASGFGALRRQWAQDNMACKHLANEVI